MNLLSYKPYQLQASEKNRIFIAEMRNSVKWHYQNSAEFKILCDSQSFDVSGKFELKDMPYLPVSIFKEMTLLSVPERDAVKTLYSSSTSGRPSKIVIDKTTADMQAVALNRIMTDFIGNSRHHFFVFDSENTVKSINSELSSRGTAIRGMLSLSKGMKFLLDENFELNKKILKELMQHENQEICYFGFTWLVYQVFLKYKTDKLFKELTKKIDRSSKLIHIGGWKKLTDIAVSKEEFNTQISTFLNIERENIIDMYGMTEQLGTVYPDCPKGFKHTSLYSDILIRDTNSLEEVTDGRVGFIQLLSPIPHSYPGISILSDDLGRILGEDDCPCGRMGKRFIFERRSDRAELKGCGDALVLENYPYNTNLA